MPEISDVEKLLSFSSGKRLGKHREYGRGMFAFSNFGDSDLFLEISSFGVSSFGENLFGEHIVFTGIFRRNNASGTVKYYREPYYTPKNPRSIPQQAQRSKLADGVVAWQALTPTQRNQYNISARGKGMSGYNLFLKNYLLSN